MKINALGGSGSGTTTLAAALACARGWAHLDVDDFCWVPTDSPYRKTVSTEVRERKLWGAFEAKPPLLGVAAHPPYMHDGRSADLRSAVVDMLARTDRPPAADDQLDDMVAYLESL